MDLTSEIKVNTCKPSCNIIPNYGYNGYSFNQINNNIKFKNTTETIEIPNHVNSIQLNIIHDNTLYSGNLKIKQNSVISLTSNKDTTLLAVNNLNIFNNKLLFNALGNMSITKNINKNNQIKIKYNANDSYVINLKDINLYHITNNNIC